MSGKLWDWCRWRPKDPAEVGRTQGLAVGVAVGAVAAWLFMTWAGWREAWRLENWWGIATAIGTVSAVIVALALSLHEKRARVQAGKVRARMAEARLVPELESFRGALQSARFGLTQLAKVDEGRLFPRFAAVGVQRLSLNLGLPVSSAVMEDFIDEEGGKALQIASMLGQIPGLKQSLDHISSFGEVSRNGDDITAFLALERVCILGRLVEKILKLPRESTVFGGCPSEKLRIKVFGEPSSITAADL